MNSNTTLVKVKLQLLLEEKVIYENSNTTLVKVKSKVVGDKVNFLKFKYNTC